MDPYIDTEPMPIPQFSPLHLVRSLEVGQSVCFPNTTRPVVQTAVWRAKRQLKERGFTVKKTPDGIRVWRTA